jgi:peptidoglycan hydrolase-like protein with peptidoglycan-binding domain
LVKAGTVALVIFVAGCANMPRPVGGNQTSYTTGSYPMPPKTAAANTTPSRASGDNVAAAKSTGDATAPDTRTRSNVATDTSKIRAAQQALNRQGYNLRNADGTMNAETTDALKKFQQAHGFRATGELDSQTMAALGLS